MTRTVRVDISRPGRPRAIAFAAAACVAQLVVLGIATDASGQGHSRPKTLDEMFVDVARLAPGFGGMFLTAEGELAIALRDTSPARLAEARAAVIAVFGPAVMPRAGSKAVPVSFDFIELNDIHKRLRKSVLPLPNVLSLDTDERRNRVRVGVLDEAARHAVEQELDRLGVSRDRIAIEIVKPTAVAGTIRQKVRPLWGGFQIGNIAKCCCTLGLVAKRGADRGILTNSHCTVQQGGVENSLFAQPSFQSSIDNMIAVEVADPPYFDSAADDECPSGRSCRYSDSAFAKLLSKDIPSERGTITHVAGPGSVEAITNSPPIRLTTIGFPLDGTAVAKIGRTTGYTSGSVTSTCCDHNLNGSTFTQLCAYEVEPDSNAAVTKKGDSGSAVFGGEQGEVLYGLLWGGPTDNSGSYFVFSPILSVMGELNLGITDVLFNHDPPSVKITQPLPGSPVSYGAFNVEQFTAQITDPDGSTCYEPGGQCTVTWSSDVDGELGSGNPVSYTFKTPGIRKVTVTATNPQGQAGQDSASYFTSNSQPYVWIKKPTKAMTVVPNHALAFEGASFDSELFQQLPCNKLFWTSSKPGDLPSFKSGCNISIAFATNGTRTVSLTGIDEQGSISDPAEVMVNVVVQTTGKPAVTILNPPSDQLFDVGEMVTLSGTATDPDGKSPITYVWTVKQGGSTNVLGSGTSPNGGKFNLPWKVSGSLASGCGDSDFVLELKATDADGSSAFDSVQEHVTLGAC